MPGRLQRVSFPLPTDTANHFDEIIDVRAPVEFADDRLTGAINLPVLNDEQRERIGTQYKHQSSFEAQKAGAALVSENIAHHLRDHFADKPRDYHPLIYCFRGGQRSRSLATVLSEIGWHVTLVTGGYKAYRQHVLSTIEERSSKLSFRVIDGLTGSGKTSFLLALEKLGVQVLDLEGLANHKGSVFGRDYDHPQPSQKRFESLIHDRLSAFSETDPIYVEAESGKIGQLNLPMPLRERIRSSPVSEIVSPIAARVDFLHRDYQDWLSKPERVIDTIDRLKPFHAPQIIERWKAWCSEGQWCQLIAELLELHYDCHYGTGDRRNYREPDRQVEVTDLSEEGIQQAAADFFGTMKK